jgi:CubicO group peptidase (beta-lactamase class C family)
MVIVRGGKIAWTYGDITQVSYVASARKSILSILYGSQVSNGVIKLDSTLAELGIDDIDALLPIEKTATVRQILTATSGVYHPSNSPGDGGDRPVRGSVQPGSQFFYNNWDFNVAGAIYEKLTGRTVFQAFADDLAVRSAWKIFTRPGNTCWATGQNCRATTLIISSFRAETWRGWACSCLPTAGGEVAN